MKLEEALEIINSGRTRYQLKHFVLGQHHSPEEQFRQLLLEANSLIEGIAEQELEMKKLEAEAEELRATGKKSDGYEAELKELKARSKKKHLKGMSEELAYIKAMFEDSPKFSKEEIEDAQADYWKTRLTRVAQLQMLSRQGGVDWAYLDSLQQAGIIEEALARIPSFDLLTNEQNKLQLGIENG